jgi:hypothetical protein
MNPVAKRAAEPLRRGAPVVRRPREHSGRSSPSPFPSLPNPFKDTELLLPGTPVVRAGS